MSALRTALKRGAARWPDASVAAAWATQGLGRGLDAEAIRLVLPDLGPAEVEAARRGTWSTSLRSAVLDAALAVPGAPWPYPRLRSGSSLPEIAAPAVLGTVHIGDISALGVLLERLPGDVLALQAGHEVKSPARPRRTVLHVAAGVESQRLAAVRRGLEMLRSGGYVLMAVDGHGARQLEVPLLGRSVGLARGAFALARISGAPLVPVIARWSGAAIEIVAGDTIPAGDELEMATAFAAWVEARVLEAPGAILPSFVELLRTRARPPSAPLARERAEA